MRNIQTPVLEWWCYSKKDVTCVSYNVLKMRFGRLIKRPERIATDVCLSKRHT